MSIVDILPQLPDNPGIYLYYNKEKELIYVGKATSLKDRVSSYFRGQRSPRPIESMIHEVVDIKWQETESVLEAIIAEANAIKKYQPRYNVDGKDDKSWNYIVITKEAYPQVITLRQHDVVQMDQKEVKQYQYLFGPYPGLNAKATLKLLRKLFRFSTCQKEKRKKFIGKPCLYYQIGLCLGVCTGEITSDEYKKQVIRPLVTFLSGRKKQVVKDFERDMKCAVKEERFEDAGRLRDQISSLQRIQDIALLGKGFFERPIRHPERSEAKSRDPLANTNQTGDSSVARPGQNDVTRVEGYDISNLGVTGKVGSMVVFTGGEPDKSQYRKFKIKTVEGQSDVDCLEEVLRRRLRHGIVETLRATSLHDERDYWPLPDVFLIDGGAPQVHRAVAVFRDLGITIPIVGIAKGPERKRNDFFFGTKEPAFVRWVSQHQHLLISVRDEAHRFAIAYQRKLRRIQ